MIDKFYLAIENVYSDVLIELKNNIGYVKPLFINDPVLTIIRLEEDDSNIVRIY